MYLQKKSPSKRAQWHYLAILAALVLAASPLFAAVPARAGEVAAVETSTAPQVVDVAPEGFSAGEWSSIQSLMRQAEYYPTWHQPSDAYTAPNRANDLRLAFGAGGVQVRPHDPKQDWTWSLALSGYGYAGAMQSLAGEPVLAVDDNRIEYHWNANLSEWYLNNEKGLEHGVTITTSPVVPTAKDKGSLVLKMNLDTNLIPQLSTDAQSITFRAPAQRNWQIGPIILCYDSLLVTDAVGRELPASFSLSESQLSILIDDADAAYPLTIDPLLYSQVAKLTAADAAGGDWFGYSVALARDTVVIGAPYADVGSNVEQGAAYIFARNQEGADTWGQVAKLTADDGAEGDWFGWSVANNGDTVVVGARHADVGGAIDWGAAYVFARNQGGADAWGQLTKLVGDDGSAENDFGRSVAIDGDTIAVGAPYGNNTRGTVYVFARNQGGGDAWGQIAQVVADDGEPSDYLGWSVAICGDVLAAGAMGADVGSHAHEGVAYVFTRNQGGADQWGQMAKLIASDGEDFDSFGWAVATSGDKVLVGSPSACVGNKANQGAAYLFERNQGGADVWGQVAKLTAADGKNLDAFGISVAIAGDGAVVGARSAAIGNNDAQGAAYLFERNQGGADVWGQVQKLIAVDGMMGDQFGSGVSIAGDTVVVGARYGVGSVHNNQGTAYSFVREEGIWQQIAKPIAADGAEGDRFGYAVALGGDIAVIGARGDDDHGDDSGAAYLFARNQDGGGGTAVDAWGQAKKITAADGDAGDEFGWSVAINGDTIVVAANKDDDNGINSGAAYVFARNQDGADQWGQVTKLTAADGATGDSFGDSVTISGDTIIVGASWDDDNGTNSGSAYVFARNQGGADNWGQVAKLTPADGATEDWFGDSVSLSGDTAVVGALYGTDNGTSSGAAYVFSRNQGGADAWGQVAKLTATDGAEGDRFGNFVAISGDTVVVGADGDDDNGSDSGSAYIFARNQGGLDAWGQVQKIMAAAGAAGDLFGYAVALSRDAAVIGARSDDDNGFASGSAYVFARNQGGADNWGQVQKLIAADGAAGDDFGYSVALDDATIVVGAHGNDDNGENSGSAYVFGLVEIPVPDLAIAKAVAPASARPGEQITYTLTFSNVGETTATGVIISDVVPVSLTNISYVNSGATITPVGSLSYTWQVADLDVGQGGALTITGQLSPVLACGVFTNTSTIAGTQDDNLVNNNSAAAVTVQAIHGVTVEPTNDSSLGVPGANVAYTLTVTNTGNCIDAFTVAVSGETWPTVAPAMVGPLAAGMSTEVPITVTVPLTAGCSDWDVATVTFTSQGDGNTSDSSVLTTTINAIYGVTVEPPIDAQSENPGVDVVYTLHVTNTANCAGAFTVTVSGETWPTVAPTMVGPLAAGMSAEVPVIVTVPLTAGCGDLDAATVTLTSQGDGNTSDSSVLTTTANAIYGIVVEPSRDVQIGTPGMDAIYTLTVTNTGNCIDAFTVTVDGEDWPTVAPTMVGPLAAGMSAEVPVTVTVPVTITNCGKRDTITVLFVSQGDDNSSDSSTLTTIAGAVYSVTVEPPMDSASGDPGTDVVYTLTLTNTGNCTDVVSLATVHAWPTVYSVTVESLPAGMSADVLVTVTVPLTANCGDRDTAIVTLTSQFDGNASDSSVLTTTANVIYSMTVEPPMDSASGDPGTNVIYTLTLTNTGNCADAFSLSAVHAWPVTYPVVVGPLAAGTSAKVPVTVTVPLTAGCGDGDTATVTFTSQGDGSTSANSVLHTTPSALYGLTVEPSTDLQNGDPGTDVGYTLHITNTGNCTDTFDIDVDGETWPTIAPTTVGPLAKDAGALVDITVTIPLGTVGGISDTVILTGTSQGDGSTSASSNLTTIANQVAPVLDSIGDQSSTVGGLLSFNAVASDANNDVLTFSLDAGAPDGASIAPSTGEFTWAPAAAGVYTITVRVTDDGAPSLDDVEAFTVAVETATHYIYLPLVLKDQH